MAKHHSLCKFLLLIFFWNCSKFVNQNQDSKAEPIKTILWPFLALSVHPLSYRYLVSAARFFPPKYTKHKRLNGGGMGPEEIIAAHWNDGSKKGDGINNANVNGEKLKDSTRLHLEINNHALCVCGIKNFFRGCYKLKKLQTSSHILIHPLRHRPLLLRLLQVNERLLETIYLKSKTFGSLVLAPSNAF